MARLFNNPFLLNLTYSSRTVGRRNIRPLLFSSYIQDIFCIEQNPGELRNHVQGDEVHG